MWTHILMFLVLWEIGASSITLNDCPMFAAQQANVKIYDDKCYYASLYQRVDYEGAQMYCEGQGGQLASIGDGRLQQFITDQYGKKNYKGKIWIGLSDMKVRGDLAWEDGSEMAYSNFAKGENRESLSDTTTPYHHCVAMDTVSGLWYIRKCGIFQTFPFFGQLPYICQFSTGTSSSSETDNSRPPTGMD